ncbi:hypothetical protein [Limnoglobus roseus]|uniref:Uncharacterized protein n=1 Tax=Limnoglobus roseus TaxID=2598579 RepID=A0A5C1A8U8_9BACT|nr:hypothetical protein [Limnoglobus roseus]QEL14945.1 hypothetical protein PX52LOC_01847 [Limnoglobus roseus]
MATFKDSTGRDWPVTINLGTLLACRSAGFDLPTKLGDLTKLADTLADPPEFLRLLVLLCDPAKATPPVPVEDFPHRLDGDAMHAAGIAVAEAAIDFFPSASRVEKEGMKGVMRKTRDASDEELTARLTSWKPALPSAGPSESTPAPSPSGS